MKLPRRAIRWLAGGLAGFEVVYVATGALLVRSGQVSRWLNRSPEKRVIRFQSAWSVVPGVAHVRGFHMVDQGGGHQLELTVDRATGFVDPLELLARRIHILGLHARGVELRLRRRPDTPEEATALVDQVPPIEGARFEPYRGPPRRAGARPGWTVVFTGARVREVRDVWVDALRLRGDGEVAASVTVGAGRDKRLAIRSADVRYDRGLFSSAGQVSLRDLSLHVRGRMEPFFTRQTRSHALLGLISAKLELSAINPKAVLLNQYFAKADWIELASGDRRLTARLRVDRGRLLPGGWAAFDRAPLRLDLAGFIAEGQAMARLEVPAAGPGEAADAQVLVAYDDYGMRRAAGGPMVMSGDGLRIEVRSAADLARLPPPDLHGRLDLGRAEFRDLTFVNELLPGGADLRVQSGRATVEGAFELGEGGACKGQAAIATTGLALDAAGVATAGDVAVKIEVPRGSLVTRRFTLDQTRVALDRFAFGSPGPGEARRDWHGRVVLAGGDLDLGATPAVRDARVAVTFSDTRPLVAFLSRDQPLRGWKKRLLSIDELTGEGVIEMSLGTTSIRQLALRGGNLDLRLRVVIDARGAHGKARARYGVLKVGIGLDGAERHLKLFRVGTWYRRDDLPGMPPAPADPEEAED